MLFFVFRVFRILGLEFEFTTLGFLFRIWEFLDLIRGSNDVYSCFLSFSTVKSSVQSLLGVCLGVFIGLGFEVVVMAVEVCLSVVCQSDGRF